MPDVPARGARDTRSWKGDAMATQTIERPVQRPAADLEALFPGRYLSVTSFKRDGTGVATPVWFVSDGSAAVRADRPALGEGPAHAPQPACPGRVVPRGRQAAQRAGPGARGGADRHRGTWSACRSFCSSATRSRTASSCCSTGSGAVSAAAAPSPTAPRWRSRSNSAAGHDGETVRAAHRRRQVDHVTVAYVAIAGLLIATA